MKKNPVGILTGIMLTLQTNLGRMGVCVILLTAIIHVDTAIVVYRVCFSLVFCFENKSPFAVENSHVASLLLLIFIYVSHGHS